METVHAARQAIADRLQELEPLVEQHRQLRKLANLLDDDSGTDRFVHHPWKARPHRPRALPGQRIAEVQRAIAEQPGITVGELHRRLVIYESHLHRILGRGRKEGTLVRVGRG